MTSIVSFSNRVVRSMDENLVSAFTTRCQLGVLFFQCNFLSHYIVFKVDVYVFVKVSGICRCGPRFGQPVRGQWPPTVPTGCNVDAIMLEILIKCRPQTPTKSDDSVCCRCRRSGVIKSHVQKASLQSFRFEDLDSTLFTSLSSCIILTFSIVGIFLVDFI